MKKLLAVAIVALLLASCGKEEGVGGKNTIQGYVMMEEYSEINGQFIISYPAQEERVYIIYGDNSSYGDDYRTNYDGSYQFDYLFKGNYQLFLYSECLSCPGGSEPLFVDVTLNSRKETLTVDTIFVKKYIN